MMSFRGYLEIGLFQQHRLFVLNLLPVRTLASCYIDPVPVAKRL